MTVGVSKAEKSKSEGVLRRYLRITSAISNFGEARLRYTLGWGTQIRPWLGLCIGFVGLDARSFLGVMSGVVIGGHTETNNATRMRCALSVLARSHCFFS